MLFLRISIVVQSLWPQFFFMFFSIELRVNVGRGATPFLSNVDPPQAAAQFLRRPQKDAEQRCAMMRWLVR